MEFKGAIFDLDGVITETAKAHSKSWKQVFDEFLKKHSQETNKAFVPFDEEKDYLEHVDGKPRIKGVRDFLYSRNINLPEGKETDSENIKTIQGIAKKKNKLFLSILKKEKPNVYETTISLVKELKKANKKIAVISSSKNCKPVLKMAGVKHLFPIIIDGIKTKKLGLSGKPDPDIFVYAAKKMGLYPGECVVFEDALSGVEAGYKGNFGLVIGISRRGSSLHYADKVVKDLKEISIKDIDFWFKKELKKESWLLRYKKYSPEKEKLREALCTTGNGYFGLRGCHETQSDFGSEWHYPGFYIAGIYNQLTTIIKGKKAINNSLVNCPNWLLIKISIGNSSTINPFEQEILDFQKILDLKKACLYHKIIFKDKKGRITELQSKRFASMNNPHIGAIKFILKPINYSDKITLYSSIDGEVKNNNVQRYKNLKSEHLNITKKKKTAEGFQLNSVTNNSEYFVSVSAKNIFNKKHKKRYLIKPSLIGEEISFNASEGEAYVLEKTVSIFTSRDSKKPEKDSENLLKDSSNFEDIFTDHKNSWKNLWKDADVFIQGDRKSQLFLRTHIYHLISSYSFNTKGLDIGITARGLHGEAYRGHVFWDEIFIFPFFLNHFPEIAKQHLIYRYNRLEVAKNYAKENGYKGAMYPWQSADTGLEETQTIHYNPNAGTWGPDLSRNQRHISLAVFYDFYLYITRTNPDKNFLNNYAAPVMIEIARFFASIAKYDKKTQRYHIKNIMGPDEFHEKYPWKNEAGIDDNAYTNIMTSWIMKKTLELIKELPQQTVTKLGLKKNEIDLFEDITKKINVITDKKILMQFKDFDKLKEINLENYRKKYKNIGRMDRILDSEGKDPNKYKILKQADTLMLFYLLDFDELISILRDLGIKIRRPKKFARKNFEYYLSRTSHGSTLSWFVHDAIAIKLNETKHPLWNWFEEALKSDINDVQGGTTSEGIHTGLMAGTVNLVEEYFAGLRPYKKEISLKPFIPEHWKKVYFKILNNDSSYIFDYNKDKKNISLLLQPGSKSEKARINFRKKRVYIKKGTEKSFKLRSSNFLRFFS